MLRDVDSPKILAQLRVDQRDLLPRFADVIQQDTRCHVARSDSLQRSVDAAERREDVIREISQCPLGLAGQDARQPRPRALHVESVVVDVELSQFFGVIAAGVFHDGDKAAQRSFDLGHRELDGTGRQMSKPEQIIVRFPSHAPGVLDEQRCRSSREQNIRHHQHMLAKTVVTPGDLSEAIDAVADEPVGPGATHLMDQLIDDFFDRDPQWVEMQNAQLARYDGRPPIHPQRLGAGHDGLSVVLQTQELSPGRRFLNPCPGSDCSTPFSTPGVTADDRLRAGQEPATQHGIKPLDPEGHPLPRGGW